MFDHDLSGDLGGADTPLADGSQKDGYLQGPQVAVRAMGADRDHRRVRAQLHHHLLPQSGPFRIAGDLPVAAGAARDQPARSLTAACRTLASVSGTQERSGGQEHEPAPGHPELAEVRARIAQGGAERYHQQAATRGKLFVRYRIAMLVDGGSFTEDGVLANVLASELPADGVVTGTATIDGRPVALMANDSTVKAGSWGARTVEKIIRIIEKAYGTGVPMIYLVDSAGARITDQVEMFPGRR